jgi:hypothetical protein
VEAVDEATRTLYEAAVALQELPVGAVMTEAHRLARKAVRAQWQAQGLKVAHIEHRELVKAASVYLDTHRAELIQQARVNLRQWSVRLVPQLRTLAARTERECGGNR